MIARADPGLTGARRNSGTGQILAKALDGERIDDTEALSLLESRDLLAIGRAAHELRGRRADPDRVTFIVDRNINYTNVCVTD
jgi:cyclic dehypoxanthinyl futalosine synthase